MANNEFTPKLFTVLKEGISKEQLVKDVVSGIIVGIVALPLAIAFAIASGVEPGKGIITAVVAGLIISAFGGSRVQIGGPTGAFVVIVFGIVNDFGIDGLIAATFMAGFIMIAMGLLRFGSFLKYVSYPLIVGFTNGIAVIIFTTQIKDFFGMSDISLPGDFIGKWVVYFSSIGAINPYAAALAIISVVITLNFHHINKKIPGSLAAILLCTAAVSFAGLPVETIETRFGSIPTSLGMPSFPVLDFTMIRYLIKPAFAIALLGSIESLLSAVVADGMIGGRHRSNIELVAQGAANIASALFGGIPATGAIARTAVNVKNGGRTPVSGIVHALTLLIIMLVLSPFARLIPLSVLAGILVVVAYKMGEWDEFFLMLKAHYLDLIVLLSTFLLTVFIDLVAAIQVGLVVSSFAAMKRMSDMVTVRDVSAAVSGKSSDNSADTADSSDTDENLFEDEIHDLPKGVFMYEIYGPLFFGAAREFQERLAEIDEVPDVLILRMRHVSFIDATGIFRLKETVEQFRHRKSAVILSGVSNTVKDELVKNGLADLIGRENILPDVYQSIEQAGKLLKKE